MPRIDTINAWKYPHIHNNNIMKNLFRFTSSNTVAGIFSHLKLQIKDFHAIPELKPTALNKSEIEYMLEVQQLQQTWKTVNHYIEYRLAIAFKGKSSLKISRRLFPSWIRLPYWLIWLNVFMNDNSRSSWVGECVW